MLAGDDPYPVLQDRGILARVAQQVLEGASLTLSPTELADLNQFKRLPPSAELTLIVLMFVGRVGTITVATGLALKRSQRPYRYPEERPIVG